MSDLSPVKAPVRLLLTNLCSALIFVLRCMFRVLSRGKQGNTISERDFLQELAAKISASKAGFLGML
jgi:hypothetical protein